jgi:hypothetical protein
MVGIMEGIKCCGCENESVVARMKVGLSSRLYKHQEAVTVFTSLFLFTSLIRSK